MPVEPKNQNRSEEAIFLDKFNIDKSSKFAKTVLSLGINELPDHSQKRLINRLAKANEYVGSTFNHTGKNQHLHPIKGEVLSVNPHLDNLGHLKIDFIVLLEGLGKQTVIESFFDECNITGRGGGIK